MNSPAKTKQLVASTPSRQVDLRISTPEAAKRRKNAAPGANRGEKWETDQPQRGERRDSNDYGWRSASSTAINPTQLIHTPQGINTSSGPCGATWTTSTSGCKIAQCSAVAGSPPDAPEIPPRSWFPAMTHTMNSRFTTRWLAPFVAVLVLTSTASADWKEKVLYSFQGGSDGATPAGGVVFDKAGNLYGATTDGGSTNCSPVAACGTVFQLAPPAKEGEPWKENILRVFKGKVSNDGELPAGGVIADATGNIYGTTAYGGTGDCVFLGIKGGCGTVYEFSPPQKKGGAWTYAILYSFKGGNDGYLPVGDLVFDNAGNLYGSTEFGGGKGTTCDPDYQYCGTVFKLSPPKSKDGKWTEQVLHSFAGGTDGANPNGGLVLDSSGAIYGTTVAGGDQDCKTNYSVGCGAVFELKPPSSKGGAWAEKVLHRFEISKNEANPAAGMTFGRGGYLYGTTVGTVFRLAPPSTKSGRWKETILYTFNQDADDSMGGLIFDASGNLYGTTYSGLAVSGTVFELKPPRNGSDWKLSVLHGFAGSPDGALPAAGLVFDQTGNLYSTTTEGGTGTGCSFHGCGTVFEVLP